MNLVIHWNNSEMISSLPTVDMSMLAMDYGYEYDVIELEDQSIIGNLYISTQNTIGTITEFHQAMETLLQGHLVTFELI